MDDLTEEEKAVVAKVLNSSALQSLIGMEEWDLTEDEEMVLWNAIEKVC